MRVALLTNILAPYRIGFYNELARLCDLHVVFDTLLTPNRQWQIDPAALQFSYTVADSWRQGFTYAGVGYVGERRYFELANRTLPLLRTLRPDIVVSLELGARTAQASLYCAMTQKPLVCAWEGTPHTEAHASWHRRLLRPRLAHACDAFWVNGRSSAEYARSLGVAADRIYEGMTGIDTHGFSSASAHWRPKRDQLRAAIGLHGLVFVFCGILSPRKGIRELLAAANRLAAMRSERDFSFLFLGEGELRPEIEAWAKAHPDIPVHLTGFINTERLAEHYVIADWAILPTLEDCFPLACLEPIACGLPQILSVYNGATTDLIERPDIGLVADPLNAADLAGAMNRAIAHGPIPLSSEVSGAVVDYYSPRQQALRGFGSLSDVLRRSHRATAGLASTSKNRQREYR